MVRDGEGLTAVGRVRWLQNINHTLSLTIRNHFAAVAAEIFLELRDAVAEHPLEPVLAEPGGVVVERVDPDAERQVLLEFGAAAGQDHAPALRPAIGELLEHPRLADAGLAADGDEPRVAPEAGQRSRDGRQLPPPADERALRPGVGHRDRVLDVGGT